MRPRSSDSSPRPHQLSGSAPPTPAAASSANPAAACLAQLGCRASGSVTTARNSATSSLRCRPRSGRCISSFAVGRLGIGSSSSRNRDGCSSSPGHRAHVQAVDERGCRRRRTAGAPRPAAARARSRTTSARSATTSTSCSEPSSDPRRRTSGQRPFLHRGDADHVPFQAFAGVRGQDLHRVARRASAGERLQRQLLRRDVLVQGQRTGLREPVGQPGRGVEQVEHGVKVTVGRSPGRAARHGSAAPTPEARPVADQMAHSTSSAWPLGVPAPRGREPSTVGRPCVDVDGCSRVGSTANRARIAQHRHQQLAVVGLAGGGGQAPQLTAQPPQMTGRRHPRSRRAAARPRGHRSSRSGRTTAPERGEELADRVLLGQRLIRPADRDRHPRGDHGPAQDGQAGRGRSDDDRHPPPRHRVVQVGPAQTGGDRRGLLGGRAMQGDGELSRLGIRQGLRGRGGRSGRAGRRRSRRVAVEQELPAAPRRGQRDRRHLECRVVECEQLSLPLGEPGETAGREDILRPGASPPGSAPRNA